MADWRKRGLAFLAKQQQPSGGFASFSSAQLTPFVTQKTYHTTFAPALILSALQAVESSGADDVRNRLATFLLTQKSQHWSFNYWARNSKEAALLPYPDDLDDTFCALAALWQHDSQIVSGAGLAHAVKLLLATESQLGGPYRTWLVPKDSDKIWLDVDLAVNANIAYFLSLAADPLPNLTAYMDQAIGRRRFASPYYPTPYPLVYYIARAYTGAKKQQLATFLLQLCEADGSWGTPLQTALAISSLLHLDTPKKELAKAIGYLKRTQQADGSWPAEAFCLDPAQVGVSYYNGAAALTTSFALEALSLYAAAGKNTEAQPQTVANHPVAGMATQAFADMGGSVGKSGQQALHQMLQSTNAYEIIMLPELFYAALKQQPAIASRTLHNLALANVYGWIAYTIYDDFLDDEGQPTTLPIANIAMRLSLQSFASALPNSQDFSDHVQAAFNTMDAANAWEVTQCRLVVHGQSITIGKLPSYGNLKKLAERSLGHTLTPLGVLAAVGVSPKSKAARNLQKALQHYIIAKQLNDDAHDWREDLAAGRITYVVAEMLRALKITAGNHQLSNLSAQLEQEFWHHTLPTVCDTITKHVQLSRQALATSNLLQEKNVVAKLLNDIDATIAKTRATVASAEEFLQTYAQK